MSGTEPSDVKVLPDPIALSEVVAEAFAGSAQVAVAKRGRCMVALSGGGTPLAIYTRLAGDPYRQVLPWDRIHFFWGDERNVPPDHPESNYGRAFDLWLGRVPVPSENIHRMRGELSLQDAADDYVRHLREYGECGFDWPRFDWVFLGLGADGHTAALFPNSLESEQMEQPVAAVTAQYGDRPAKRITLTPSVINSARAVAFVVTGNDKAHAVASTLTGPLDLSLLPAQRICLKNGKVTWWLDDAAATLLTRQHQQDP